MFKQPRFVSPRSRKIKRWFFAGLDTRHLNVYCFENSFSSFDENYKSIYSIEFTSQLSRLLKSIVFIVR